MMNSTIKLDQDASCRVLDNAIRTQAQVVLESGAFPDATINGFLITGDDSALLVEVNGQLSVPVEQILGARCEVNLYGDERYGFSSVIRVAPQWGNSRSLAIARPKIISVVDRRSFLRAKLAPSTKVKLEWERAGVGHRHVAVLLNISAAGLACRVDDGVAGAIEPGYTTRVKFAIPDVDRQFSLGASVSNKTPASEGCTILGLHFVQVPEDSADLDALRAAFRDPRSTLTTSEVCV